MLCLGCLYKNGFGAVQNEAKAIELYRRAFDCGPEPAAILLVPVFERGLSVANDDAKAVELSRRAAGGGCEEARKRLDERGSLASELGSLDLDG